MLIGAKHRVQLRLMVVALDHKPDNCLKSTTFLTQWWMKSLSGGDTMCVVGLMGIVEKNIRFTPGGWGAWGFGFYC